MDDRMTERIPLSVIWELKHKNHALEYSGVTAMFLLGCLLDKHIPARTVAMGAFKLKDVFITSDGSIEVQHEDPTSNFINDLEYIGDMFFHLLSNYEPSKLLNDKQTIMKRYYKRSEATWNVPALQEFLMITLEEDLTKRKTQFEKFCTENNIDITKIKYY